MSNSAAIDYALVERSLGFHGIPMQKMWEGEHGDQDLIGAAIAPDYGIYHARQKGFVFADRAKRLKLHQFLARKADILFARQPAVRRTGGSMSKASTASGLDENVGSIVPPYNFYLTETHDKSAQLQHIYRVRYNMVLRPCTVSF